MQLELLELLEQQALLCPCCSSWSAAAAMAA
jgi:hypothetical protein